MEYSIYITYNCNLRCSFCYLKEKLSDKRKDVSDKKINQIVKYIASNKKKGDWVVFFGGEPLLVPQIIDKFIKKLRNTKIRFAMYTNGLLLDKIPLNILKKIDVILFSVNRDKRTEEKYKSKKDYFKVIKNIKLAKAKTGAYIIGRMTIDEETSLLKSALNLLKYTDGIYWQIVSKPTFKNPKKFIKSYKKDLQKLFNHWFDNFRAGKKLEIMPFQAVISTLVFNYPKNQNSFRCRTSKNMQTIDIDGKIYWCDELVGNKKALIGNITDKHVKNNYKAHYEIFGDCKTCDVSKICRGRCRKCLEVYTPEHNRVYCELTKFLINIIEKRLGEIKKIVKKKKLTLNKFYKVRYLTEEIP